MYHIVILHRPSKLCRELERLENDSISAVMDQYGTRDRCDDVGGEIVARQEIMDEWNKISMKKRLGDYSVANIVVPPLIS